MQQIENYIILPKGGLIMDENKVNEVFDYYNNKNEHEKHLKGYMYDSLIYRYQLARYTQADLEAQNNDTSIEKERRSAQRDILRFIQILDEAIGEHD